MNNLLDEFIQIAKDKLEEGGVWREDPVDLLTFFKDKDYLNETPFPGKQTELLETVNEIVRFKILGDEDYCSDELQRVTELAVAFGKGCHSGESLVIDSETGKSYTFDELYESGQEIMVTSLDEDTQRFVKAKASEVVRVGKGEIWEVVTASGRRTKVFPEHKFLHRKGRDIKKGLYKGLKWKSLRELNVGDNIALARKPIIEGGDSLPKEELRLIGYLIGDGCVSSEAACMFYASNPDVEKDYCSILNEFGVVPKYPKSVNEGRPDRNCVCITATLPQGEAVSVGGNPILNITRKYGIQGTTSYTKRVPKEFLNLNKECTIEFLRALFATDGWVCLVRGTVPQIGYCSVSKGLIEDINYLLHRIGIVARIYTKKTKSNFGVAYQLMITNVNDFIKFSDQVKIIGKEQKQQEIIKFLSDRDNVRRLEGKRLGKKLYTDIFFDRITEINYIGEDYYYDLTIDEYANYVSDGFVDHNSGKDFLASGILAYMCYVVCCIKDPQEFFGFGQDEPIDLINVAINAYQANNVFFKKFKARLVNCKWFKRVNYNPAEMEGSLYNEFQITKNQIRFYKNITAHSAHSEADSFEGFNPLIVIFDEIGGFEVDKAESAYKTLRSSATSRYNDKILLIFISFPRSSTDFMIQKLKEAETDPEVYAIVGKSWEVNPKISRESLQKDYDRDPESAKMKYECEPPLYATGLFQFPEKVDEVVAVGKKSQCQNLVITQNVSTRTLYDGQQRHFTGLELFNLNLDPTFTYYIGGDGGVASDSYVICLMHAEPTLVEVIENGESVQRLVNKPVEDLILEWEPSKKDRLPVDLLNVADILEQICKQVHVKKALFDKFNSADVVQRLMTFGVEAEDKNFSNPFQVQIYQNLKGLIYTGNISLLDHTVESYVDENKQNANEELKAIQFINGNKVDHLKGKNKDYSDARAAASWICSTDDPQTQTHFAMPAILGTRR